MSEGIDDCCIACIDDKFSESELVVIRVVFFVC